MEVMCAFAFLPSHPQITKRGYRDKTSGEAESRDYGCSTGKLIHLKEYRMKDMDTVMDL